VTGADDSRCSCGTRRTRATALSPRCTNIGAVRPPRPEGSGPFAPAVLPSRAKKQHTKMVRANARRVVHGGHPVPITCAVQRKLPLRRRGSGADSVSIGHRQRSGDSAAPSVRSRASRKTIDLSRLPDDSNTVLARQTGWKFSRNKYSARVGDACPPHVVSIRRSTIVSKATA